MIERGMRIIIAIFVGVGSWGWESEGEVDGEEGGGVDVE